MNIVADAAAHRGADPAADARSRFVDDFEALLDHLDIPKTAIVAQSMSGGTAAGFTVRRPERVSALVLADTLEQREPPPGSYGLLMAMGPGFCSELVLLQW